MCEHAENSEGLANVGWYLCVLLSTHLKKKSEYTSLVIWWLKNPPCNAGNAGSIPGQGTKNPHAAELLSLCAITREPVGHNKRTQMPQLRPDQPSKERKKERIRDSVKVITAAT